MYCSHKLLVTCVHYVQQGYAFCHISLCKYINLLLSVICCLSLNPASVVLYIQ